VFSVLTIPADIKEMTANLKAPLVINLKRQIGRQVVLQENEYVIKHPMFAELRAHLITMQSMKLQKEAEQRRAPTPISVDAIPPSTTVKSLQV
jgi:hypothetical protein